MTLIDYIRKARRDSYSYIAIDEDNKMWAFDKKPFIEDDYWDSYSNNLFLGFILLQCDWTETLIKLDDIKCT